MGLLDGRVTCGEHQCPMITVGENYCCVIEYTNDLIGAQQVTSVIPGLDETPTRLVFANGRALPLLCPDCGEPLQIKDGEFADGVAGLYLFALAYVPPSGDTPEGGMELVFAPSLSSDGLPEGELPEDSQSLLLHLDSVRGIEFLGDL